MKRRYPVRPAQRDVRNLTAFYAGEVTMERAPLSTTPKKPRKQAESRVNKTTQQWGAAKGGALYRNARGLAGHLPPMMPVGVGPPGTGDELGWIPVVISPAMVGRTLPIYCELEDKTETGRLAPHQLARIEYLRDLNAICGCVRSADDCEDAYHRWLERVHGR